MVRRRAGRSALGCLVMLLLLAGIAYFGFNLGEMYLRFYRYEDAMRQEARFAAQRSDGTIKRRLSEFADSVGLTEIPAPRVRRRGRRIEIWNDYVEVLEGPLYSRDIQFHPRAEAAF